MNKICTFGFLALPLQRFPPTEMAVESKDIEIIETEKVQETEHENVSPLSVPQTNDQRDPMSAWGGFSGAGAKGSNTD